MTANPYSCPKCQAETTQSITMILQTGTQHGTSSTAMSGVGFTGGGMGVGVGTATTSTSTTTALARKYRMPFRPTVNTGRVALGWIFLALSAIFLYIHFSFREIEGSMEGCLLSFGVLGAILGGVLVAIHPSHRREILERQTHWDARKAYLAKTWVCFRCGQEFQPE